MSFYSTKVLIPAGSRIVCPKCKRLQATLTVNMSQGMVFKSDYFKFVEEMKQFYFNKTEKPMISYCHLVLWGNNIDGLFIDFKGWVPGSKKPLNKALNEKERRIISGPKHFFVATWKKLFDK